MVSKASSICFLFVLIVCPPMAIAQCDHCAVALDERLKTNLKINNVEEYKKHIKSELQEWRKNSTKVEKESGGGGQLNLGPFSASGGGRSREKIERELKMYYASHDALALDSFVMHELTASFLPKEAWHAWRDCVLNCSQEIYLRVDGADQKEILISLRYLPQAVGRTAVKITDIKTINATQETEFKKEFILNPFEGRLIKLRRGTNKNVKSTLSITFSGHPPKSISIPPINEQKPTPVNVQAPVKLKGKTIRHLSTLPDGGHKLQITTGAYLKLENNRTELRANTKFEFGGRGKPNVVPFVIYRAPQGYEISQVGYGTGKYGEQNMVFVKEDVGHDKMSFFSDLTKAGHKEPVKTWHYHLKAADGTWPKTVVPSYNGAVTQYTVKCTHPYIVTFYLGEIIIYLKRNEKRE